MTTLKDAFRNVGFAGPTLHAKQLAQKLQTKSFRAMLIRATHPMDEPIRAKWAELGWEQGALGRSQTNTQAIETPSLSARFTDFEHGSIYWSEKTNAHAVLEPIRTKWAEVKAQKTYAADVLPSIDTLATADGIGRFNYFQFFVSKFSSLFLHAIYWTEQTSAHYVGDPVLLVWEDLGSEKSFLGYPISDITLIDEGKIIYQCLFQHGKMIISDAVIVRVFDQHGKLFRIYTMASNSRSFVKIEDPPAEAPTGPSGPPAPPTSPQTVTIHLSVGESIGYGYVQEIKTATWWVREPGATVDKAVAGTISSNRTATGTYTSSAGTPAGEWLITCTVTIIPNYFLLPNALGEVSLSEDKTFHWAVGSNATIGFVIEYNTANGGFKLYVAE